LRLTEPFKSINKKPTDYDPQGAKRKHCRSYGRRSRKCDDTPLLFYRPFRIVVIAPSKTETPVQIAHPPCLALTTSGLTCSLRQDWHRWLG
jgi:hypothetical protein